jgi:hypothetical protein
MIKLNEIIKNLPEIEIAEELPAEAYYHGFAHYLSKKINLLNVNFTNIGYRHGWIHGKCKYIEELTNNEKKDHYFVETKYHEDFLKENGIKNVTAIGSTYLYIDKNDLQNITRYKNSLLVMPAHSTSDVITTTNEVAYIKEILDLKNEFDLIVFCIHQDCIKNNLWIKNLKKYNLPYILGGNVYDKNSLLRMSIIFNTFEYMTTNAMGSHIAYAAYSGCKTSVFGTFFEYTKNILQKNTFLQRNPLLMERTIKKFSETYSRKHYSFLFRNPKTASIKINWGKKVLGYENKLSYNNLLKTLTQYSDKNITLNYDFSIKLSNFFNYIQILSSMNYKYILYGNGSSGNLIKNYISNNIIKCIDKDTINKNIFNLPYDYVIITPLGRELEIKETLTNTYSVPEEKIIYFNINKRY